MFQGPEQQYIVNWKVLYTILKICDLNLPQKNCAIKLCQTGDFLCCFQFTCQISDKCSRFHCDEHKHHVTQTLSSCSSGAAVIKARRDKSSTLFSSVMLIKSSLLPVTVIPYMQSPSLVFSELTCWIEPEQNTFFFGHVLIVVFVARLCCFRLPCLLMCWRWPPSSCVNLFVSWWKRRSWLWRVLSSFTSM